jgi:hypothetical protein
MRKKKIYNIEQTAFKVPEDYFESFDQRVLDRINDSSLSKVVKPGFVVPEGYFNSVEDDILKTINSSEGESLIRLKPNSSWYYLAGIAASLILAAALFFNPSKESSLTVEMVESYFANSGLNSYELAELLSQAELLEDDFNAIEPQYEEDNLELYLLDHVDFETVLE